MDIGRRHKVAINDTKGIFGFLDQYKGAQTTYLLPDFLPFNENVTSPSGLWPRPFLRQNSMENILDKMKNRLMYYYDFLGLTERMEESLAVMVLLFDLEPSDVIVLSSKRSGGYDAGGLDRTCTLIPKAVVTPRLQQYLQNQHHLENVDYLLYHTVNKSLDLTIQSIGVARVHKMVETIKRMHAIAEEKCQDEAQFPCSPTGELQTWASQESCYYKDSGCGYKCVDRVLDVSTTS